MTSIAQRPRGTRSTRLVFAGFVAVASAITLLGALGIFQMRELNQQLRETALGRSHKIALVEDMVANGRMRSELLLRLNATPDSLGRVRVRKTYSDQVEDFAVARKGLE